MIASLSWVVGRGGLLGRHVETSLGAADGAEIWRPWNPIAWHDPQETGAGLDGEATRFLDQAAQSGKPWRLLWCAGTSGVATTPEALSQETVLLGRLLGAVARRVSAAPLLASMGTLFYASSAGGVYAGGTPPFDEYSPTHPLAPYGCEKLIQEDLTTKLAERCGVDLLIGRFSNLYGTGQNLAKPQGLVAHVGRAALRREPVSIWVPLDTIRDYLFAADAGRMVAATIERREEARRQGDPPRATTKIFASQVEATVALVLATWRQALRRPLRVALGSSPVAILQPRVLSFRSCVWPELRGQPTLLPLGVAALRRDQLAQMQASGIG
jgi:UDP-glucose 4-epimerase